MVYTKKIGEVMHIDKYTMIINEQKYDHNKKKHLPHQTKVEVDQCIMYKNLGHILEEFQEQHRLYGDIELTITFTDTDR